MINGIINNFKKAVNTQDKAQTLKIGLVGFTVLSVILDVGAAIRLDGFQAKDLIPLGTMEFITAAGLLWSYIKEKRKAKNEKNV